MDNLISPVGILESVPANQRESSTDIALYYINQGDDAPNPPPSPALKAGMARARSRAPREAASSPTDRHRDAKMPMLFLARGLESTEQSTALAYDLQQMVGEETGLRNSRCGIGAWVVASTVQCGPMASSLGVGS